MERAGADRMAARAIMRHCQICGSCGDLFTVVELILIARAIIGRRLQNYREKILPAKSGGGQFLIKRRPICRLRGSGAAFLGMGFTETQK